MAKKKSTKIKLDSKVAGQLLAYIANRNLTARYAALKPDPERPAPRITTWYTETEDQFCELGGRTRPLMYAKARDLYDNCSVGAEVETVIRLAVGVDGGTPIFEGENAELHQKIWHEWKRKAGYFDNESWNELLQQILRAVLVDGDCFIMIDDQLTDGKLAVYPADCITNISQFEEWKQNNNMDAGCRQVEGVVLSPTGRVLGSFLTAERNRNYVSPEVASFIPAEVGHLVFLKNKLTQYRGESSIISQYELSNDTNDLLKAEIRSAQINAEHAFIVTRSESDATLISGVLEGLDAGEQSDVLGEAGITEEELDELKKAGATDPETYKAYAGKSAIAELPSGSQVTNLSNANRPSAQIQTWIDHLDDNTGKRLGIMSCLSRGRADNSYSSGQIELAVSWAGFKIFQKMLERKVLDYVIDYLLPHAEYVVEWQEAFSVDPEKDEKVTDLRLHGGRTTFREILGVNWREKLLELAEEKKFLEEHDLTNLSFWQTSSGASIPEQTPQEPTEMPVEQPIKENENNENAEH